MLIVDMFESLDKLLVTQELQFNKTKQNQSLEHQYLRNKPLQCICGQKDKNSALSDLVAKRTKNLALHCVCYIPKECHSPYSPEFALRKKCYFDNFIIEVPSIITWTSVKYLLINQKLRDLGCRFVVRGEMEYICTFCKHKSTYKESSELQHFL